MQSFSAFYFISELGSHCEPIVGYKLQLVFQSQLPITGDPASISSGVPKAGLRLPLGKLFSYMEKLPTILKFMVVYSLSTVRLV